MASPLDHHYDLFKTFGSFKQQYDLRRIEGGKHVYRYITKILCWYFSMHMSKTIRFTAQLAIQFGSYTHKQSLTSLRVRLLVHI